LLARAHHLSTGSVSKIYFRPYLLLPEQNEIIEEQVANAKKEIEEEEVKLQRRDSLGTDAPPEDVRKEDGGDSTDSTQKVDEPVEDEG
jgi:hypothetical protein